MFIRDNFYIFQPLMNIHTQKKPFISMPGYFYSFNRYLQEKYGERVQKITIDAGFSCPNRQQKNPGCLFCDPFGSGNGLFARGYTVEEQLRTGISQARSRYKANFFFAYFQAFSNTYGEIEHLKKQYRVIEKFPEIIGLAVGTRPDCINKPVLDILESYAGKYEVWLELGIQTSNNASLEYIRRGHTWEDSIYAVKMLVDSPLKVCLHFVLGLPEDTIPNVILAVKQLIPYNFNGIKIHNLYITRDSPLSEAYKTGQVDILDYQQYITGVCDIIEFLPQTVIIQRLLGEAQSGRLIAPEWSLQKHRFMEDVRKELIHRKSFQGIFFNNGSENHIEKMNQSRSIQ